MKSQKKTNRKKGITLAELAVALAVIVLVSGAAISLIVSSSKMEGKSAQHRQIQTHAENSIECFRFSDDGDEFLTTLKKTDEGFTASSGYYILENGGYTVQIQADFITNTLQFTATSSEGEELYQLTYTKG